MGVGYVYESRFSAGTIYPISMIFGILNKKSGRTLSNFYLFSCRYENVWDISICLKPPFYKKMSIISKPYHRFSSNFSKSLTSELSSFISASLKSIMTVELAAQIAGQISS